MKHSYLLGNRRQYRKKSTYMDNSLLAKESERLQIAQRIYNEKSILSSIVGVWKTRHAGE